jgi:hypothetical protein
MNRIHILTTVDDPAVFNCPILHNRSKLAQSGLDVRFFFYAGAKIVDCDVLCINSKYFRDWHATRLSALFETLTRWGKKIKRIVWFDTTDGSGAPQFEVLPYVQLYAKTQLLRDRSQYYQPHYGGRIFTDFYHKRFQLQDDDTTFSPTVLDPTHAHKVTVSWNSAIGAGWCRDYFSITPYHRFYRLLYRLAPQSLPWVPFPLKFGAMPFTAPGHDRPVTLSARFNTSHKRKTIRFQREHLQELLKKRAIDLQPLPREEYFSELRHTRIGFSPFGWGEVCWRDWDIISSGAALIKPSMAHLETWPDLYVPDETFISYAWDFSDFDEKLDAMLATPDRTRDIAQAAQKRYQATLSDAGRAAFCERFSALMGVN